MGDGGPRFYLTLTPVSPDPASAFFLVNTKDYEGAVRAADRAWKYLYANHPEAQFKVKRLAMGAVESGIVDVEISGPDADRLLALGKRVRSLLRPLRTFATTTTTGATRSSRSWSKSIRTGPASWA